MRDDFIPDAALVPLLPEREAVWWSAKQRLRDGELIMTWWDEADLIPPTFVKSTGNLVVDPKRIAYGSHDVIGWDIGVEVR